MVPPKWEKALSGFLRKQEALTKRYAQERQMRQIPVTLPEGKEISLSPGSHSKLIKAIIEEFAPRFAPGSIPVYAGDTGDKWGWFDEALLRQLGVTVDSHGKMPDVVLYIQRERLAVFGGISHQPWAGGRQTPCRTC